MRTDDLIDLLARDPQPEPTVGARLWRLLPLALALSATALLSILGLRVGLFQAYAHPLVLTKFLCPLVLGLGALVLALRSARPDVTIAGKVLWVAVPVAAGLFLAGLQATPVVDWLVAIHGRTLGPCLALIPLLSMPPLAAVLWALRGGAPVRPDRAGLLAGLAAGGLATAIYALHCPEDNPLFYVPWYGTGILVAALVGRTMGRRLLRW